MTQALIYIHQAATHAAIYSSHHGHHHGHGDGRVTVAIMIMISLLTVPGTIMYLIKVKEKGWNTFNHSNFAGISVVFFIGIICMWIILLGAFFIYQLICMNS